MSGEQPEGNVDFDGVTVLLLGGPCDGDEHRIPMVGRSHHELMASLMTYYLPLPRSEFESMFVPPEEALRWPLPPSRAAYSLLRDEYGYPRRNDTGRLQLKFMGVD